jgi:hypothetical protein
MSDAVGIADKFLLGFFGYIVYHYGRDFCKTMIWDNEKEKQEDKSKDKDRMEWIIDNSLLSIEGHIAGMNEKLSEIQEKVTLLEENTLFHIPPGKKFNRNSERGTIEYEEVDFGVHTPEVTDSG